MRNKKIIFSICIVICIFFVSQLAYCQTIPAGSTGSPAGDDSKTPVSLPNPLGENVTSPEVIIGRIINGVLGVVGSLALVMFIYGGLTWMLAAGSPNRVQKGKDILLWSTIGLIVIFSSYALVKFIFESFFIVKKSPYRLN